MMKCYENGTVECVEYRCLSQSSFCRSLERGDAKHALKTGEDTPPPPTTPQPREHFFFRDISVKGGLNIPQTAP